MRRIEWKQFKKKKGRLQRKRIKYNNCHLDTTQQPKSFSTENPKTRRKSREN